MKHKYFFTIIGCFFLLSLVLTEGAEARNERQGIHCYTGTTLGVNDSTTDYLDKNDTDYFAINVTDKGLLTVYTTGSTDTYGYLRDPSCSKIAENDDMSNKNRNFKVTYDITTPGTYFINVEGWKGKNKGSYTLVTEMIVDDHGNNCSEATTVAINTSVGGNIEVVGDKDYFKVVVPSQGNLSVYTSGSTNTFGRYYNTSCNQEGSDNDSGSGTNFKIQGDVTAGTYYFSVEERGNNSTGTYTVHVDFVSNIIWNITSSVTGGVGGTISPSGTTIVSNNGSQAYIITPSSGNDIADVKVDGVSVGVVTAYSFTGVTADHSIEVTFQVPAYLCTDLSDIPLDTRFRAAPANIMFVLDDSGSMDWEFMTSESDGKAWIGGYSHYYIFDDPGDNVYYGRILSRGTDRKTWKYQWSGYNKIYYNPDVDYTPWPTLPNADPDNPQSHPKVSGNTLNLDGSYDTLSTGAIVIDDKNTAQFARSPNDEPIIIDNEDAGFAVVQEPSSGALRTGEYSAQAYDSTYRYTDVNGSYTVTWTPTSLPHGNYDVYAIWQEDPNNSTAVTYSIDQNGTDTTTDTVDQSGSGGTWIKIGSEIEIDDGYGTVTLTHTRTSDGDRAVADAVKFIPIDTHWESASNSDAYDDNYYWTPKDTDGTYPTYFAAWYPNVSGDYYIYTRWVDGTDRASAVNYFVKHSGGTDTYTVDQRTNGGTWRQLGSSYFTLDASSLVYLLHAQSAVNNTVAVADAIRLVPTSSTTIDIKNAHYYVWSESESKPYLVVLDGTTSPKKILYYAVNELPTGTNGLVEPGELNLVAGSPPDDVKTSRSYTDERQNFANWFSFYRKRELTAAAAVSRTIAQMQGVYVGINTINHNIQQPVLGIKAGGVDETATLLNLLYNLTIRAQGTPLRRGLRDVGRYYDQDDNIKLNGGSGNDSPFAAEADGGACQQAFAIAMTDGYYNGSSPSVGNQDSPEGSPYADSYSDTLADVAMKYYKEDLSNSLPNYIQGNAMDPATHQHMVSYGVSFGVRGKLVSRSENPVSFDYDYDDPLDPNNPVYPIWPNPSSGDQEKIDDLMHSAFNGRGLFLSASNPDDLIESLLRILEDVELRIGSASSVSVNGDELYEEVNASLRIFQSSYDSENWSGNVQSFGVDQYSASVQTDSPFWQARDVINGQDWDSGRIIVTYDGTNGIPFRTSDVQSAGMLGMLDSNSTLADKVLKFIRGDHSYEKEQGGTFRDRIYNLGDIVHSSPTFKHGILYVGGNDGMLHALYSEDDSGGTYSGGQEYFAYVPKLLFSNLNNLTDTTYSHEYFVDLTPKVQDVDFMAGSTRITTMLVGGLGKGGKGYYALNVSGPDPDNPDEMPSISTESDLASKVMWEYPNSSTPVITKSITDATNTSPIIITAGAHGLSTGDIVEVEGVQGNTAANGRWVISVINNNAFSLDNSTGSGTYTSGGTATYNETDDLGYSYSMPLILQSNKNRSDANPDGDPVVLFSNGYNSLNGHAVLYILNPANGTLIRKIDTGEENAGSPTKCNGLSTPVAIDTDNNQTVDYVFAGDLQGNLWKFDLTSTDSSKWGSAYKDASGVPKSLFQATDGANPQPITTRPDVMSMSSVNQSGYLVLFATGRYLGESDTTDVKLQSIYGIWDYGDDWDDSEYLGTFTRIASQPLSNQPATVSLLEQTEIINVNTYDVGSTTQYSATYDTDTDTTDGDGDSTNNFDREGNAIVEEDHKPNPTNHVGWYFDLPISGERVVTDPLIRSGNSIVISYVPENEPCSSSGFSVINEFTAISGARLEETPWDINNNSTFDKPEYDTDGNLTNTGDYLIHDKTAVDNTTAMGTVSGFNTNKDDYQIVAPSRIKKAGRLMSPAIASLPEGELKIMSSSTANAATQNITTIRESGPVFGIRYWFERTD